MSAQENAAGPEGVEAAQEITNCDLNRTKKAPKKQSKAEAILSVLKSGVALHRFSAAQSYGDHCLHSTISELKSRGYSFESEWILVPTRFSKSVRVKLYRYVGAVGDGAA